MVLTLKLAGLSYEVPTLCVLVTILSVLFVAIVWRLR